MARACNGRVAAVPARKLRLFIRAPMDAGNVIRQSVKESTRKITLNRTGPRTMISRLLSTLALAALTHAAPPPTNLTAPNGYAVAFYPETLPTCALVYPCAAGRKRLGIE